MTIVLRGISSRASGSTATISLTQDVPSLADGDFMLMVLYANNVQATPPQPPAGWTLVDGEVSGSLYLQVWSKIANSEPGSYTISQNTGSKTYAAGIIAFYSTAGKTMFVDAHANQANASSANRTAPGVTTTQTSAGLACFIHMGSNSASAPPGDMTEKWDELLSSAIRVYAMTSILVASGATGDKVATGSALSSRCVTVAVAELPTVTGTAAITLGALTVAAVGSAPVTGVAAITLGALTMTAAGSAPVHAAAAITLSVLTVAAAGQVTPLVPAAFTATAVSTTSIELAWTHGGGGNLDGFQIERSPDGTTGWTLLTSPAAADRSYVNTGLTPGIAFHYRIRAYNT